MCSLLIVWNYYCRCNSCCLKLDSLKCQIVSFGIVVRFRCHSLVNRYITEQNKPVFQVQDIQKAIEEVMSGKKLR